MRDLLFILCFKLIKLFINLRYKISLKYANKYIYKYGKLNLIINIDINLTDLIELSIIKYIHSHKE